MNDRPISVVLARLYEVTGIKPKQSANGWDALCPAHDDRRRSLSVAVGDDGRALLHCHAGCTIDDILKRLKLTKRDIMAGDGRRPSRPGLARSPVKPKTRKSTPAIYPSAREAIAELERRHGKRSAAWSYKTAQGEPVGVVVRWDTPAGKDIRPVARVADGWIIGGMPAPRPLYRLPDLIDATRVYVTEGEKAADAARSLGLVATTSAHGSKSANKTDWTPLAGKEVVILPDNDDSGRRYAAEVASILATLTPAPVIKIVDLPDLPHGGDMADFVAAKGVGP